MKKLTGIEVVEVPEVKPNEFLFSTGEKMCFKTGVLNDKQVTKVVERLFNHARYIAKHSDRNVTLPADLKNQLRKQVEELNSKGFLFRFYLRVGADIISEQHLRELADPNWVYNPLWIPGTDKHSYTVDELNGSETGMSVMGAFQNADETGVNSTLMLLGHPWDDKYPENGKISQQQAIGEFIATERDDGLETSQTDHRDAVSMYIMDRNDRINSVILAQGWMRIPLGRRSVVGVSVVGDVISLDGRWKLSWDYGYAYDSLGVGLSAGLAS